jgi:O-antigen ligase
MAEIDNFQENYNRGNYQSLTRLEGLIISVTMILLVFPAWVRAGTISKFLAPNFGLTVVVLFIFLLAPYLHRTSRSQGFSFVDQNVKHILHDPVFYVGSLFLCQLFIQWWNSGKVRILLDLESQKSAFSPPYIDWLPGAVDTSRSWDMLVWFFPAFVALMIVRHAFHNPRMVRILFWGIAINATLLALFGLIAPILAKNYSSWIAPIIPLQERYFFSTFGYPNNGGSFFVLHFGLVMGLFCYYAKREGESRSIMKIWIMIVMILLFFLAIHLTRCRFAILFSWLMGLCFMVHWLVGAWKSSGKQQKIKLAVIATIVFVVIASFGFYLTSKHGFTTKLSAIFKPGKFIAEQFNLKFWQTEAAAKMLQDYPVFGIGGGGYRKYLLEYVTDPEKRYFATNYKGMAFVHNDFMQFLCEFGIVGTGLLLAVFILLVVKIAACKEKKEPFFLFGLLGLSGVLLHSLIDLPFRSPPVIIAFTVVLAGYGSFCLQTRTKNRETNVNEILPAVGGAGRLRKAILFYAILFLFISILGWWVSVPIRQKVSANIVKGVEEKYKAKLITLRRDNITPWKSENASPQLLSKLKWAKLLYAKNKKLYILSARINFDLYRKTNTGNKKKSGNYLRESFRSSLTARSFTNYADIGFIKLHTAILDALGYYLEESWCLLNLRKIYSKNIRINLLVREYYSHRPHLYR